MVGAAHASRRQPARNRGWGSGAATRQARDVEIHVRSRFRCDNRRLRRAPTRASAANLDRAEIMWAYAALHDAGLAHSYKVWDDRGELVAGGYGVACGRVFVGESMS